MTDMKRNLLVILFAATFCIAANADIRNLIPEEVLTQIAEETSGEAAKRNLDTITLQHRMRASDQFAEATEHVLRMLREYRTRRR